MSAPKIKKLDPVVVNRIAAGEVIQRPANALKELIENCLDAKSTNIQITVKDGGLKLLQIQDNGTGIRKDDLEIVCERFTTSKLQDFDDLKSISTFGFRGEALASVSHVAQLTITTKTADETCAYKASYNDGKLKESPTPCAGNQGTIITVENLFYNVPTRRKALSNALDEFLKISDVVQKYAVHNPDVGFTLKKHGDVKNQVRTPHSSTKMNNIRILYGNPVFRELLEVTLNDEQYKFKLHALVTNPNYSNKKLTLLLFINNRLVDSTAIRKMLEDLYSIYLPKKTHPFCYISLEIAPANIDVNVHPTKHEVRFLYEDMIIDKVKLALDEKMSANDASRTFYIQNKLPTVNVTSQTLKQVLPEHDKDVANKTKKLYQQQMVRTDASDQKLDAFNFTVEIVSRNSVADNSTEKDDRMAEETKVDSQKVDQHSHDHLFADQSTSKDLEREEKEEEDEMQLVEEITLNLSEEKSIEDKEEGKIEKRKIDEKKNESSSEGSQTQKSKLIRNLDDYCVNKFRRDVKLLSVLRLRKSIEENYNEGLRTILANLTFVGCVDAKHAVIQSDVNLYICNTQVLAEELFYEIMLYNFANHGIIKFSEPLPIQELAVMGLETEEAAWNESYGTKEDLAENVKELMMEKADMLREYFSIIVDKKGNLKSLPILIDNYFPSMSELPLFVLRLATEVEWNSEKPCFQTICRETARFYSRIDTRAEVGTWMHKVEHILYTAFKESLLPPKKFVHDSTILQIASLPDLYKVFERC